ncbi:type 1 glutamine amidotransferase domain-containing protein [Nakamurella endophytica]|uniref:Glutamine amidotransferase n=1 Tax=Nakamurella endophytica TaxID=1748367 RepID=A0A917STS1_9ACTN|nr:type 1 glutamine amidotransferase domain-containing protein [Nakamurella endophytica]GGL97116.1 glutamine amidotransferase [Nakamurella endophytica]
MTDPGNALSGRKVLFVVANSGVEQPELTAPWQAVLDAGGQPVLAAPEAGEVQAFTNDVEKADTFTAELAISDVDAADYVGLVLPGGTTNADKLRMESDAVALVSAFTGAGKPVAAICHGPWALVEADAVRGKTLTSYPSLQTDIRNAGGTWVDQQVSVCPDRYPLVTSRDPDDLEAFCPALVEQFAQA